jgi:hypothetical protein
MSNLAWELGFTMITTQPQVAAKLPLLSGPGFDLHATRAGPLLQSVDSCSSLQVSEDLLLGLDSALGNFASWQATMDSAAAAVFSS